MLVDPEGKEYLKSQGILEFGELPVLEVGIKQFSNTRSILMYLARKFNLYPTNPINAYEVDSILSSIDDYMNAY